MQENGKLPASDSENRDLFADLSSDSRRIPSAAVDEGQTETFVHEPLEDDGSQIRLLQMLLDGDHDESRLHFSLVTQYLDQTGDFSAISYTWGDRSSQYPIWIDGKEFRVYGNCYSVLRSTYRHWRQGHLQSSLVWIDSISINQANTAERSTQVSFMGDIYAKAEKVLACIGSHSGDSRFFIEKAMEVAHFKYPCDHDDFLCEECREPWEEWTLFLGHQTIERLCKACETFGELTYWTRVWIIQEVAKATSLWILCENEMLPWTYLNNLEEFLGLDLENLSGVLREFRRIPFCAPNKMHDVFVTRQETIQLHEVFTKYSRYCCWDVRDHLYGLLGMVEWPREMAPIKPDYDKSTLELAMQLVAYLPLELIPDILSAFEISFRDETIASMINHKRSRISGENEQGRTENVQEFRSLYPQREDGRPVLPLCARLDIDSQGDLTTAVVETDEIDLLSVGSQTSMEAQVFVKWNEDTVYPDRSEESADAAIRFLSSTYSNSLPQRIRSGSEIVGLACREACQGDLIVPLSRRHKDVFLVLRQNKDDVFDLVGQAILLHGYRLGCLDEEDKEAQPQLFEARVEVVLTAADAILLFAQDLDISEDGFDRESCWARVVTPASQTPFQAARLTAQKYLLTKDVLARNKSIINPQIAENWRDFLEPNTGLLRVLDAPGAPWSSQNGRDIASAASGERNIYAGRFVKEKAQP